MLDQVVSVKTPGGSGKMTATAVAHRERLALRLLQNWTAMHPTDTGLAGGSVTPSSGVGHPGTQQGDVAPVIDDSLTSLTWLQNLNVMKLAPGTLPNAPAGRTSTSGSGGQVTGNRPTGAVQPIQQQRKSLPHHVHVDPNAILDMTGAGAGGVRVKSEPASPSNSRSPPLPRLSPPPPPRCADTAGPSPPLPALQRTDGSTSASATTSKPNLSYATLICMAMNDAPGQRVTLSSIYSWILDNFPYFRTADPSWQNSIRHNLSLNKCFQRVQRQKSDPGKGSYWTINPEFQPIVERDFFRKRPATPAAGGASGTGGSTSKKVCRRSTVDEGQRTAASNRRDIAVASASIDDETSVDEFLNDLSGDDSLTDVLDMSWSTILGRSLSCPAEQSLGAGQGTDSARESRPQGVDGAAAGSGSTPGDRATSDHDTELVELIRACADTDPGVLDDLSDFGLDVDGESLDLTIHGIGLRPPDWWTSLGDSFDGGSRGTASDSTTRRRALNTPSPGPIARDETIIRHPQQEQPHPWAENRGQSSLPFLGSSLDALGLLSGGPPTPFDSDVAEDY